MNWYTTLKNASVHSNDRLLQRIPAEYRQEVNNNINLALKTYQKELSVPGANYAICLKKLEQPIEAYVPENGDNMTGDLIVGTFKGPLMGIPPTCTTILLRHSNPETIKEYRDSGQDRRARPHTSSTCGNGSVISYELFMSRAKEKPQANQILPTKLPSPSGYISNSST